MAGFYGADVAQLRSLAKDFQRASQTLQSQGQNLTRLVNENSSWKGADAQQFKQEWNSSHRQSLMAVARMLEKGSKDLKTNAEQQEKSSEGSTGSISGSSGPGGSGSSNETPGNKLLDWAKNIGTVLGFGFKIKDTVEFLKDAGKFLSTKKILDFAGDLKNLKAFSWADDFKNATGIIGKFGRFAGPILAPISIFTGIHDMFSPGHDGWRGIGDRVAGGLSVIGGVGTIAMAAGLLTNPVGIGIVVGAGLIAGGWALGNMIADSEWGKATGRWISDRAGDVWNGTKKIAGGVKDAVSNTVDGAKKFLSNPVKSLGGLLG